MTSKDIETTIKYIDSLLEDDKIALAKFKMINYDILLPSGVYRIDIAGYDETHNKDNRIFAINNILPCNYIHKKVKLNIDYIRSLISDKKLENTEFIISENKYVIWYLNNKALALAYVYNYNSEIYLNNKLDELINSPKLYVKYNNRCTFSYKSHDISNTHKFERVCIYLDDMQHKFRKIAELMKKDKHKITKKQFKLFLDFFNIGNADEQYKWYRKLK